MLRGKGRGEMNEIETKYRLTSAFIWRVNHRFHQRFKTMEIPSLNVISLLNPSFCEVSRPSVIDRKARFILGSRLSFGFRSILEILQLDPTRQLKFK